MMSKWYVIQVLTNSELDVKRNLEAKGFSALVPRRVLKEQKNGRWKEVERILFPSYVFVQSEMTPQDYHKISMVFGLIRILKGASSRPEPVREDEMHMIFDLTRTSDLVGFSDIYMEGQNIKVVSGPLVGLEGCIRKIDKRRFRAKAVFTIAGIEKEVELGINMLEKIESK